MPSATVHEKAHHRTSIVDAFKANYAKNYKKFFLVPVIAVIFCIAVLGAHYFQTGEFVSAGTDLKGGVIVTVGWQASQAPDINALKGGISAKIGLSEVSISRIDALSGGALRLSALEIDTSPEADPSLFLNSIHETLSEMGFETSKEEYGVKIVGPSIAGAVLASTYIAILIGFALLGFVIFLIFKNKIVIATVLSCLVFDFLGGLTVMNLLGIKLSPLAIASLLMLIGFSIDSDILITTAVLKSKEGLPVNRAFFAMRTGITMALAAVASLTALYVLSGAAILKDMTAILIGGLVFDLIHTWFTNLGILLWVSEKRDTKQANSAEAV